MQGLTTFCPSVKGNQAIRTYYPIKKQKLYHAEGARDCHGKPSSLWYRFLDESLAFLLTILPMGTSIRSCSLSKKHPEDKDPHGEKEGICAGNEDLKQDSVITWNSENPTSLALLQISGLPLLLFFRSEAFNPPTVLVLVPRKTYPSLYSDRDLPRTNWCLWRKGLQKSHSTGCSGMVHRQSVR